MGFAALMRDPAVYASGFDLPHPSVEQWHHTLQRHGPNDHWLGAIAEDQLVGWGCITVQSDMRRRHAGVLGLAIARAWWGRGVGTAVMRELLSLADDWLNLQRLELSVFTSNARAVALYERHGFETEGTQRAHALRAGRFEDTYLMSRLHPRPASVAVRAR
jgi:L-phenylalanine/L-methionine N-acetyltransferase